MVSNHSSTDLQLVKSGILLFIKGLFSLKWEQREWGDTYEMYLWNAASAGRKSIWVKMIEKVQRGGEAVGLAGSGRLIQGWNPYFFPSAHLDMHRQLDRTWRSELSNLYKSNCESRSVRFRFTADQCQYSAEVFYLTANTSIWDQLIGKRTLAS